MFRVVAVVLACSVTMRAQEPLIPKENPHQSEADLARGKKLYAGQCAPCHGPSGEGGRGANLARPTLPRAADDASLFRLIRDGIPDTEMPGAWILIEREIWQVAAHVRRLGRVDPTPVPGDPARGEALYRGKGKCAPCHTVKREGGRLGPDLSEIGARRSPEYLRESLIKPEAAAPEDFVSVRLKTRSGQSLRGVRLNEDTYSVQIRDLSDSLHSFWKKDLAEYKKERDTSLMPSYSGAFTPGELDDLVAYLASLRGKP